MLYYPYMLKRDSYLKEISLTHENLMLDNNIPLDDRPFPDYIVFYNVDIMNKQLTFCLSNTYSKPYRIQKSILCKGYFTHIFEEVLLNSNNLPSSFREYPIDTFIKRNKDALETGKKIRADHCFIQIIKIILKNLKHI